MLDQHPLFTFADRHFFDSPANWQHGRPPYGPALRPVPAGWERVDRDVWVALKPAGQVLPAQGWKVHVSARPDNAEQVLAEVADYCFAHRTTFKFLRDPAILALYNSKYAPRQASGKFIAAYPPDEAALEAMLTELGGRLAGEQGPYVLSDLRWGDGPLHVRYGGFTERFCVDQNGEYVLAVETPDGTLVPDRRGTGFRHPDWVSLPAFLQPHLAARGGGAGMPYEVEKPLHFSNGGGLYLARHRETGVRSVLKEARPHAGLDRAGKDAVSRLRHERDILDRLAGIPGVPAVHGWFPVWEHQFLAMEYLPGPMFWQWLGRNHPLVNPRHTATEVKDYVGRALALIDRVERLLDEIHARGVVVGDLSPSNVIIGPDDSVSLVDYEAAGDVEDTTFSPPLGTPGFVAWAHDKAGTAVDRHALAALRLWMFLPLNTTWSLDPGKVQDNIDEAEQRFELPGDYCRALREELRPPAARSRPPVDLAGPEPDLAAARRSLVEGILASATPERTDRLFPGDIRQFAHDGVGFAYGAAGVLWALSVAGAGRFPEHEQWLLDAVGRGLRPRPGFGTGLSGVAYVLDHFGHADAAAGLLERAVAEVPAVRRPSLFRGLAGTGLTLLHFAARTGDRGYLDLARDLARPLPGRLAGTDPVGVLPPGLFHGWSGAGLFFLRLFEADGDPDWLDAAVAAVHRDLDGCVRTPNGSLQVEEAGVRTLAYLEGGSSGIGLVAQEVLRHRPDERLRDALAPIRLACSPEYVAEPQLFNGRSGLLASLCRLSRDGADPAAEVAVRRHVRRFSWYALPYAGHLAFAGERSLRLSMDLATGGAGVLLALATVERRDTGFLPFLAPARAAGVPAGAPARGPDREAAARPAGRR